MAKNGWESAMACAVICLLMFGVGRVAPLYYVECLTRYDTDREYASFPFILCYILRTLPGPVVGVVGQKCGLKETTLAGCLLAVIGLGMCCFAEDILAVTITWGVIFGLGSGIPGNLLPSIINGIYEKNQARAHGFALAGAGMGGLILPLIARFLIDNYGTSGSFLIISAIALNSVPAAMLLKNPKSSPVFCTVETNHPCHSVLLKKSCSETEFEINTDESVELNDINHTIASRNKKQQLLETGPEVKKLLKANNNSTKNVCHLERRQSNEINQTVSVSQSTSSEIQEVNQPVPIIQLFYIFANPTFVVISVVQSLHFFSVITIWTVIVDLARNKEIPNSPETYVVLVQAIADIVGHLSLGFITDGGYMTRTNFIVVCFLIFGLSFVLMVVSASFALLMFAVFLCAAISGGLSIVFPGIINEFIRSEHRTIAVASRFVLMAPLSLTISPLIGYFRVTLGSYNWILYIQATICVLCCGLTLLVPYLARKDTEKRRAENGNNYAAHT